MEIGDSGGTGQHIAATVEEVETIRTTGSAPSIPIQRIGV